MEGRHDLRVGFRLWWPSESLLFTLYRTSLRAEGRAATGFLLSQGRLARLLSLIDPFLPTLAE